MPCGKSSEMSLKGYFGEGHIHYGRQMCRVVAPHYEEVVVDRLFAGNLKLTEVLQPMVKAAEEVMALLGQAREQVTDEQQVGKNNRRPITSPSFAPRLFPSRPLRV
jgi:hypothetical protein